MYLYFDRTGYPMVPLRNMGYLMHLFPVTKQQFAQCDALADSFEEASQAISRAAPHAIDARLLESALMTGVLPSEVEQFSKWLSEGQEHPFEVPTTHQWPDMFNQLMSEMVDELTLIDQCENDEVRAFVQRVLNARSPISYMDLSLKCDGVVEWVLKGTHWRGRGQPRYEFSRAAFGNPDRKEITPVEGYRTRRSFFFGFRLIQPI